MAYYEMKEQNERIVKVKAILEKNDLDFAVIYYDEFKRTVRQAGQRHQGHPESAGLHGT